MEAYEICNKRTMGRGRMSMREIIDLPFNALVYRVKTLEDKIAEQNTKIAMLASQIAQNKPTMGLETASSVVEGITPRIEIPKELLPTIGKHRASRNRTYEIVKKRWGLWKLQFEAGMSQNQIARAWGCDHGSINHAKNHNFEPRRSVGRPRVKNEFDLKYPRRSK